MSDTLSLLDRLRIERAVWTVDAYLAGLPGRARVAVRRELRANLRASAARVGPRAALRDLGSLRRLSIDYLNAEYGEGRPRPRILKGLAWVVAVEVLVILATIVGFNSFIAGLGAGAAPPGRYTWDDLSGLGLLGEVSVDDAGEVARVGGSLSLVPVLAQLAVAYVVGSRLWRLLPLWRNRSRDLAPAVPSRGR